MKDENIKRTIVLGGVILFLTICFVLSFWKPSLARDLSAKGVIDLAWSQAYPPELKTEFFFGKEAGGEGRDIGAWTDLESGKAEIFIGNFKSGKGFVGRSGGTFYELSENDFGYEIYISRETGRRANVKKKAGGYDSLANSTQMSYFDIVRNIFREKTDDFEFSFIEGGGIKAVPVSHIDGDYAFRLFYLGIANDGSLIIPKIEYFSDDGKKIKTRVSSDFRKYEVEDIVIWRPDIVSITSENGVTEIRFTQRKFNVDFGDLSEKDLKDGRPSKWRD